MSAVHGIRANLGQFLHQLLQVLFVGLTFGMTRTVVPALAESEFGVPKNSFFVLTAFVVAVGVVKAVMNFAAGRLSERIGRKRVLALGWLVAFPIPLLIWFAPGPVAPRAGLLVFGLIVIGLALLLTPTASASASPGLA